ncbi:MAG TPA: Crp/Fnr family transcriptional regulator [Chitinophagaceae bacterium]|jgi:CRP-like cAMP-binding protein|nr:Crp/Fnr family transcriptional regulator [Chitinophagaceae bacterium]
MNTAFTDIDPVLFDYAQKYIGRFMPITREELVELLQYCEIRKFDKRAVIVRVGEVDNYLNLVVKGLIRKYLPVRKDEVILQLATEGHVVQSEISFLTQSPSMVVVETLEPTILLSLTHDKMEEALDKFPKGERLGRMIISGMYIKKDENRYNRLSKSTRQRFFDYIDQHQHMLQRVPQKYLASYLQIKPETFSRLKALLAKRQK